MKVPFGDMKLHYQTYKTQIDTAVHRVLESGHYILGSELEKFEADFEKWLGAGYAAGCASGTEAIYLALAAAGVTTGDEVIVVAHTAVPTISAISMTGATPVFVDIDPNTCLMDVELVEVKITPKTKAIVPVHLYGQVVDMDPLLKIAAKHNLMLLEDCAQSTGATYKGAVAGTMGDYGAFSFYPSKNLGAFGDGGGISTNKRENFDQLVKLRNYGQSKRYYHDIVGINSRLDEMQAAILGAQLPFVHQWNERRREIAKRYNEGLKGIVQTPVEEEGRKHVYHLYVIQSDHRDELQEYLLEKGVGTLIHYPNPAHLQKAYGFLGYKPGALPQTEKVVKRILSLPMHPGVTDEQVDIVIDAIGNFYSELKSSKSSSKMTASSIS